MDTERVEAAPTYPCLPTIPPSTFFDIEATKLLLYGRSLETQPALDGLAAHSYTINGVTKTGKDWITSQPPVSLAKADQYAMAWTTVDDVYKDAEPLLPTFAGALQNSEEADKQFWPMIARYGLGYNLLILKKADPAEIADLREVFGARWPAEAEALCAEGRLYSIDMRIFEKLTGEAETTAAPVRFTPGTVTLLEQNPLNKTFRPYAIRVSTSGSAPPQIYLNTDPAWLYALQAAKTSITVYGIWLGHVYQWHLVTAAMLMNLNLLPAGHVISQMFTPQSNYLAAFDQVLLQTWGQAHAIAPPTSIGSAAQFSELANLFGCGHDYASNDPKTALSRLGLSVADFTSIRRVPWDLYPVAQNLLTIWDATNAYVTAVVTNSYADNLAVVNDKNLQAWLAACRAPGPAGGNITTLPAVQARPTLIQVLTSLLYRIMAHGTARLNAVANPGLSFVGNFPPCLQRADLPSPNTPIDAAALLSYLPNTGTIGGMVTFYFTFAFSAPYVSFLPNCSKPPTPLWFFSGGPSAPCNKALADYRTAIAAFEKEFQPDGGAKQACQWPLNIET